MLSDHPITRRDSGCPYLYVMMPCWLTGPCDYTTVSIYGDDMEHFP